MDQDERGSVTRITDASGATTSVNSYDEYGIPGSSNQGRFGYTGQAWLSEIGLAYYKARIYSPTLGRFMQTDPIGYADGPNWYNYVGSDPINGLDPLGLDNVVAPPIPVTAKCHGDGCGGSVLPPGSITNVVYGGVPGGNYIATPIPVTGSRGKPSRNPIPPSVVNRVPLPPLSGGHYYDTTEQICRQPLSQSQRGQINRATALPDGTISPARSARTYPVGGWLLGIIPTVGGYVTTRFSADANIAVNTTTSLHLFVGTITRTIYSNDGGTFIRTVGSGNAGSDIVGKTRDELNGALGPGIFHDSNGLSRTYAKEINPSC